MTATWCINPEFDSVQITFDSIPAKNLREEMKNLRFKWHRRDRYWFARKNPEGIELAKKICGSAEPEPEKKTAVVKTEKPEKKNLFGVRVGDIFSAVWGYDQTNVDFFQVVKLCGEKSVKVRGVYPKMVEEQATGGMSAYRTYEITREILPAVSSVFIKDTENGDLKRLKSYAGDGISNPVFEIGSGGHLCHLEPVGQVKHFESWDH